MPDRTVHVMALDTGLTSAMRRVLSDKGFSVRVSHRLREGVAQDRPGQDVTAVLVDARLLAHDPAASLARLRSGFPGALLFVMAGRPDHPVLVAAVRDGALPLTASFDLDELVETLGGDGGLSGVREPRRPRPPVDSAAAALQPPAP